MKKHSDIVACVIDYGYFISLAEKLAETYAKVYYHSPFAAEFLDVKKTAFGMGLEQVVRCDEPLAPDTFAEIDLFIFPDIGFVDLQLHLRACGKAVWGSFEASDLEVYRTKFVAWLNELGLPVAPTVEVNGLSNLEKLLSKTSDKWIKVDRFRSQMETWYHQDELHSRGILVNLNKEFGEVKEQINFVVQDTIPTEIEIGYDGWCVDGQFPTSTYQGYEGKNEIYLGSRIENSKLPQPILEINDAISSTLETFNYRNFIATEIRVAGKNFFIDPTMRMPGQTGEQLLETCSNLPEVIWHGANGELIDPVFKFKFAASATIHYTEGTDEDWKILQVPEAARQWTKLAHFCIVDGVHRFPPSYNKELGVVIACGDTIEEVFQRLKKNTDALSGEPVSFRLDKFFDILDAVRTAEKAGMKFSDGEIPTNKAILEYVI